MSRRNPGAASAMGVRGARERLAATLGGAGEAWDSGDASDAWDSADDRDAVRARQAAYPQESTDAGPEARRSSGLLEMEVPAAGLPITVPPPDSVGAERRRRFGDVGQHSGGLPGHRRDGAPALSARVRVRTGVRAAALLGVLAVVLGGCFWWQAGTGDAQVVPLNESAPAAEETSGQAVAAASAPAGDPASAGPGSISVHVAGAVAKPGVVQLPAGSRVHEAITAAGGATDMAEPDRLNLAAVLEDGQKVLVPVRGQPDPAGLRRRRERRSAGFGHQWHESGQRWGEDQPQHRRRRGTRDPPARRSGPGAAHRGLAPAARAVQNRAGARCS